MKLNQNNISQKRIGIVIVGVFITISAIVIYMSQFVFSSQSIKLKNKSLTVEYGEPISLNMIDYLNLEETQKEIISDIKMETSAIKYENNKDYPSIGNYKIVFTYKDEKVNLDLKIKDTKAPRFKNFENEIELIKGYQPTDEDIKTLFVVEDLDETVLTIDHSKVDYKKTGVYKTTVQASDSSKNKTTQDLIVNIIEPTIRLDQTNVTLYVQENLVLKASVNGINTKVSFQSRDKSVAEVDEHGKVTAKKKGNVTIIAQANGVKAECRITVKVAPTGATATIQKDANGNQVTVVKPPQTNQQTNSGNDSSSNHSGNANQSGDSDYDLAAAKESLQLQNQERAKQGLPALKWSDSLYVTAKIRAKEIVTSFSHTRPNGGNIFDMIQISWKSAGENIGMGTHSAASMVNMWMNSAGHKANIMADNTHAAAAKYGNHWVTIFVKQ